MALDWLRGFAKGVTGFVVGRTTGFVAQGRSFLDDSSEVRDEQARRINDLIDLSKGLHFKPLQESHDENSEDKAQIDLRHNLTLKLIQEELNKVLEEKKELRQKADTDISKVKNSVDAKADESESANQDAIKYRLLASLILFGVLDVIDIFGKILENFEGVGKQFEDGVKAVMRDTEVLGFLGTVNEALKIDEVFKALSQFPVLIDLNQFLIDLAKSDTVGYFAEGAGEMLNTHLSDGTTATSPAASFLLKGAILMATAKAEFELYIDDSKKAKESESEINKLESHIRGMLDDGIRKFATSIIPIETKQALKNIDFKVLQDIRKSDSGTPEGLKEDLEKCKLLYNDGKEISADTLLDPSKYDDAEFIAIMKLQPRHQIDTLTKIVEKNSNELTGNVKENYTRSRRELLARSIGDLTNESIESSMYNMGGKAKTLSGKIPQCEDIEGVLDKIMGESGLNREEVDKVILALAVHPRNVDARIAEIKIGDRANEVKKEAPMDFVGGAPGDPTASAATANPTPIGPISATAPSHEDGRPTATKLDTGAHIVVGASLGYSSVELSSAPPIIIPSSNQGILAR